MANNWHNLLHLALVGKLEPWERDTLMRCLKQYRELAKGSEPALRRDMVKIIANCLRLSDRIVNTVSDRETQDKNTDDMF